ncbi:histidine--tRNA ligase [Candidatus Roizmanbacteria bacterium]|nr:histidine--tRNA ligase [Candidatus Roizmanbacteria bacterium]
MNQAPQTLKGFRDFLSVEAKKRQWLKNKMSQVFERFGYEPLETPAIEYESLLLGKYGEEAEKLIYKFEDQGGRKVALRYDQTVPTARIIAQYRNELTVPFKRYQIQLVWRAEKPQKGRYREFYQCDADIIGSTSETADAEILAVYAGIYRAIGFTSLKIKINDRQELIETIQSFGIDGADVFSVIQTIDKLDKKTEEEVIQELIAKGYGSNAKNLLLTLQNAELPENLQKIVEIAEQLGVPKETFEFVPTLARGLDYYTGLIFEGCIPEYGTVSVGGGGRYDNLIANLVGIDMPAVGFGIGFDRTLEAADAAGLIPSQIAGAQVFVSIFSPDTKKESFRLTNTLREAGISAECALDENKKLDAQLKYANKKEVPYVVILGPDEIEKGIVKVKNMKTGEQREVKREEAVHNF